MDKAIVCDIDDTLVEDNKEAKPIKNVVEFIQQMSQTYRIILMTARYENGPRGREFTINQMRELKIPFDQLIMETVGHENHEGRTTIEHGIWKASEIIKLQDKYEIVLFIDNNSHARKPVKKLGIETKKPENIKNKTLTKTLWNGIFV